MLLYAVQGYVTWVYWIAHCSHIAHLAPALVPVALSLGMSTFNIGVALAALAGGLVVDRFGAVTMALAGVPVTLAALALWAKVPERAD
jgi:predicted MFS family arabinose efflux permease